MIRGSFHFSFDSPLIHNEQNPLLMIGNFGRGNSLKIIEQRENVTIYLDTF